MSSDLMQAGLPPANDRMLTTCFLAAVLHGILILGVTFSAPDSDTDAAPPPALEVVLVDDQAPPAGQNPDARYVAQRTQRGSGNAPEDIRTRIPKSSSIPDEQMGIPGGEESADDRTGADAGDDEMVAAHSDTPSVNILYFAPPTTAKAAPAPPLLLENRADVGMMPNDDGVALRVRGEARRRRWIAADTRQSDVAVYLEGWRRKIERVGTINFPDVARRQHFSGTPVIEATIGADGRLLQILVRRSSGHVELDEAAMRILRLAAPYERFSKELGATHDQIRIAYEWQFLGGAAPAPAALQAEPDDRRETP